MFVDEARIYVKAGSGGHGAVSFHHEKYRPMGGPDGGGGGIGGSVWAEATRDTDTLAEFSHHRHWRAENGRPGEGNNRHGANGEDLVIKVPVGTQVRNEGGDLLADLSFDGQRACLAAGGKGGRGNAVFATPRRKSPRFAEKGDPGEEGWLSLELKLIADVGLVGLPNAGKSTLVSHASMARPRIADYPFTTLNPVLGVVPAGEESPDEEDEGFILADLPGLIEGAHEGKGLGLRFLRHVERTKLLLHLVDLAAPGPPSCLEAYELISRELESYDEALAGKPRLVAGNKIDVAPPETVEEVRKAMQAMGLEFHAISALTGEGMDELMEAIGHRLKELRDEGEKAGQAEPAEERTLYKYRPRKGRGYEIIREEDGFRVTGEAVEKLVERTDLENQEAVAYLQRKLRTMGVEEALEREGVLEGDAVYIGDEVFDYYPD